MSIKIPWWRVSEVIISQVKRLSEDIQRDKADGEITREEWKDILAENMLELIPELAELLYEVNK